MSRRSVAYYSLQGDGRMNKFYQVPVWFNVEAKDATAAEQEVQDYMDSRIGGTSGRDFQVGDAMENEDLADRFPEPDEDDGQPSELDEWLDYDPDC